MDHERNRQTDRQTGLLWHRAVKYTGNSKNLCVTALIECGVCEPSNYTGFYIKCNLLRNKEK